MATKIVNPRARPLGIWCQAYRPAVSEIPDQLRSHGLQDAHDHPLVSAGKDRFGWFAPTHRVAARDGWTWPELELRGRYAYTAVHVDLDESQAHARVLKGINNGLIPTPNWLVERMVAGHGHGHAHVAWTLAHPVYRGAKARVAPLQDLARTNEYLASILKGNPGFAAVLVHNPVADLTDFRTHWMARQPYTLRELLAYVPKGWRRPRQPRTAVARDIHLFENGIRWTGRKANLDLPVFDYLMQLNGALAYPLGTLEVAGIAHRIEHLPGHPPAGTEPQ